MAIMTATFAAIMAKNALSAVIMGMRVETFPLIVKIDSTINDYDKKYSNFCCHHDKDSNIFCNPGN